MRLEPSIQGDSKLEFGGVYCLFDVRSFSTLLFAIGNIAVRGHRPLDPNYTQVASVRPHLHCYQGTFHTLRPEDLWRGVFFRGGGIYPKLYSLAYWRNKISKLGSLHLRCTPTFNFNVYLRTHWRNSGVSFTQNAL